MSISLSEDSTNALRLACKLSVERELASLDAEAFLPSARAKQRLAELERSAKRRYWKYVNTRGKKAVAILAAAIALTTSTVAAVEPLREPVIRFITEACEKFTRFFFYAEDSAAVSGPLSDDGPAIHDPSVAPQIIEQKYRPTLIPEGFAEIVTEEDSLSYTVIWQSPETGEVIEFKQSLLIAHKTIDTENAEEVCKGEVNGNKSLYVKKEYNGNIISYMTWYDNQYLFQFICRGEITKEMLSDIAKSVKIVK